MTRTQPTDVIVVLSTAPDEVTARRIARQLVEESMVACVNLVPAVASIYRWQGRIEDSPECVMVIKTTRAAWPRLQQRLPELHPYEVPELLALEVAGGHAPYLAWVGASMKEDGQ